MTRLNQRWQALLTTFDVDFRRDIQPLAIDPRRAATSVIVPMRDAIWSLAPCLENLRYTTGEQDEIIVVDDGSIGPAAGFARQFAADHPQRIRSIRNETPRGLAAASLQGLEAATRPRAVRDGAQPARRRRLARASGGPPGRRAQGRRAGPHVDAGRGRPDPPALLPAGAGAGAARRDPRFRDRASARREPRRPRRGGAAAGAAGVRAARATAGDRAPRSPTSSSARTAGGWRRSCARRGWRSRGRAMSASIG